MANFDLKDIADTFLLDSAGADYNDHVHNAQVDCQNPTNTPTQGPSNTPTNTPTATNTPQATNTPVPTATGVFDPATMDKLPLGPSTNNVVTGSSIPRSNLFLCEADGDNSQPDGPVDGDCDGPNENKVQWEEFAISPVDKIGAFEFQIKFDHKIFDINLECVTEADPGTDCTLADTATWDIQLTTNLLNDPQREWNMEQCFRNVTENYINFACVSFDLPGGPPPESSGLAGGNANPVALARVTVHPDEDLKFRLTPGNDNGIIRVILDENCELVDNIGHPVSGSIAGGLTSTCGDIAITVRILEGDMNLDCSVDLTDAQMIAHLYGMVFGLFLYDPWFDLEPNIKDFDIDAKDLQKVFGRIDSNCQNQIPSQPPLPPVQE
jgi:hypothetical protein